jgi:hypothetical protein
LPENGLLNHIKGCLLDKEKCTMEFRQKVSVSGVIIGSLVAVVVMFLASLGVGFFIGLFLAASGTEMPADIGYYTNPFVLSITLLIFMLFSIMGGYIAAKIADHDELLNGALSSFLPMLLAICSLSPASSFLTILVVITSPLFALLGGYLRLKHKARKQISLSGGALGSGPQPQELQTKESQTGRSRNSQGRTGQLSPLIRLGGIVIVIGVIWSLWFGWSLGAFICPGLIILLGYGIFRLIGKGKPRSTDGSQE